MESAAPEAAPDGALEAAFDGALEAAPDGAPEAAPDDEQAANTTAAVARSPPTRVNERLVDKLLPPVMGDELSETP